MTRVLLVGEDDAVAAAAAALAGAGVDVDRVGGAAAALARAESASVECVLVAAGTAGGVRLLERLRRAAPSVAAGMLATPGADADAVNRATAAGLPVVATGAEGRLVEAVEGLLSERAIDVALDDRDALRAATLSALRSLPGATSRAAAESAVVEAVGAACSVAWVCRYDPEDDRLVPAAAAGVAPGALGTADAGAVDWTVDALDGATPTGEDDGADGALPGSVVVPVATGDRRYGTLHLSGSPAAPDERALLADLGDALAARIAAVDDGLADSAADTGDASAADAAGGDDPPALELFGDALAHELSNHLQRARFALGDAREDPEELERLRGIFDRIDRTIDEARLIAAGEIDPEAVAERDLAAAAESAWEHVDAREARLAVVDSTAVTAHQPLLEAALENLFRNSVEHAGPEVRVRVGTLADGAGFYVADDGPGVPPEDRDRIFEVGYAGNGNTGVGLALVERVARAHGWTVTVGESEDGGARFEVREADEEGTGDGEGSDAA